MGLAVMTGARLSTTGESNPSMPKRARAPAHCRAYCSGDLVPSPRAVRFGCRAFRTWHQGTWLQGWYGARGLSDDDEYVSHAKTPSHLASVGVRVGRGSGSQVGWGSSAVAGKRRGSRGEGALITTSLYSNALGWTILGACARPRLKCGVAAGESDQRSEAVPASPHAGGGSGQEEARRLG